MIIPSPKRRLLRLLPFVAACLLLPGCLKNKLLIKVNSDGSGKIFVTRVWSQQIAAMYGMQMGMGGPFGEGDTEKPKDPFYNEAAMRAAAGEFGPGVTFVKARKYDNAGSRGYIALYKFENVNDIFVNMRSIAGEDMMDIDMYDEIDPDEDIELADKEEDAFEFTLVKGARNKLTITVPKYPKVASIDDKELPDKEEDQTSAHQMRREMQAMMSDAGFDSRAAMMMMSAGYTGNESQYDMMARSARGTRVALEIEVNGKNVKMQASHPDKQRKNRATLIDFNMDKAITDKDRVKKLMKCMEDGDYNTPLEGMFALRKTPGMLLETNKAVTVVWE